MSGDVKIDFGTALPWAEEKVKSLFGKDAVTLQHKEMLKALHDAAVEMTATVQCIGMIDPVPFDKIYQPTKLRMRSGLDIQTASAFREQSRQAQSIALNHSLVMHTSTVESFIESPENAVVTAGPGWGKTTFLHYLFRRKSSESGLYTVLLTLRRPNAVAELEDFVGIASKVGVAKQDSRVLLLVDGYDEITQPERGRVSEALLRFSSAKIGRFVLTCRDQYTVINLNVAQVKVDCFDLQDKYRFVKAFLDAAGSKQDAIKMVNELEERDLGDFLSHPLLLALACIVKTGRSAEQPRSALKLLDLALTTLQYAWDMRKGINREGITGLDGSDRIQILKHIAFLAKTPFMPTSRAEGIVRKALDKMQIAKVDPALVLKETAQFYGILVQNSDGWEFVHRSIQDFLAAKHWVESGTFAMLEGYEWNTRTAYAASYSSDATRVLEKALGSANGLTCVAEILMNAPSFDMTRVADALRKFYLSSKRTVVMTSDPSTGVSGYVQRDLFELLSARFLNFLLEDLSQIRSAPADVLVGYCLATLRDRKLRMDHQTFDFIQAKYPSLRFQFRLEGGRFVTLEMARP